jgi:hypothetical protein
VAGIKKNIETVLLAELFLIRYIKIVKAPNDTKKYLMAHCNYKSLRKIDIWFCKKYHDQ